MGKLNENHFLMAQIRKKIRELNRAIQAKRMSAEKSKCSERGNITFFQL